MSQIVLDEVRSVQQEEWEVKEDIMQGIKSEAKHCRNQEQRHDNIRATQW